MLSQLAIIFALEALMIQELIEALFATIVFKKHTQGKENGMLGHGGVPTCGWRWSSLLQDLPFGEPIQVDTVLIDDNSLFLMVHSDARHSSARVLSDSVRLVYIV